MDNLEIEQNISKTGKFSWKRIFKIIFIVVVLSGVVGGVYFGTQTRQFKIAYASLIHNNHEHYLGCYDLPFYAEVEKTLAEHEETVEQLQSSNTVIEPEKINCKGWDGGIEFIKGDVLIKYSTHKQREEIEKKVGDSFFGMPWRGESQ